MERAGDCQHHCRVGRQLGLRQAGPQFDEVAGVSDNQRGYGPGERPSLRAHNRGGRHRDLRLASVDHRVRVEWNTIVATSSQTANTEVGQAGRANHAVGIGALLIATNGVAAEEPPPS